MKLDSAEYPIDQTVIFADEDRCIYDTPIPKLEETWNRLVLYYAKKAEKTNWNAIQEGEFFKELALARVESETALTAHQLVAQNIIGEYPAYDYRGKSSQIKSRILEEIKEIIKKRRNELVKNIEDEKCIFDTVRNIRHAVKILDGKICALFSHDDYVDITRMQNNPEYSPKGLSCTIIYRDIVLEGYLKSACTDNSGQIEEYFYERSLLQSFQKYDTSIEIGQKISEECNPLCLEIIDAVKNGHTLVDLYKRIMIGLSKYVLSLFLQGYEKVQYVNSVGPLLLDGYTAVFFVIIDDNYVYKVVRDARGFNIYINGYPINIKNLK